MMRILCVFLSIFGVFLSQALACAPPSEFWNYHQHRALYDHESGQGVVAINGYVDVLLNEEELLSQVQVTVTLDGEAVEGRLELGLTANRLLWRSDGPIDPGLEYAAHIAGTPTEPWHDEYQVTESLSWDGAELPMAPFELSNTEINTWEKTIYGDCVTGGWVDSCGGCEQEVLDEELHWRIQGQVALNELDPQFLVARMALGPDVDSVEEALQSEAFIPANRATHRGVLTMGRSGGLVSEGSGSTACAALEIARADGQTLFSTSWCDSVPVVSVDPPSDDDPVEQEVDIQTNTGCSASPMNGGTEPFVFAVLLLLGLGRRALRR